jgi:hypothetical protein
MKITTELSRDMHFVLTDDEDRIVAVISVPKKEGVTDITDKVMLAIKEDSLTHDVNVTAPLHIDLEASCKPITFDVEGLDNDDDEDFAGTYYLEQVEIY